MLNLSEISPADISPNLKISKISLDLELDYSQVNNLFQRFKTGITKDLNSGSGRKCKLNSNNLLRLKDFIMSNNIQYESIENIKREIESRPENSDLKALGLSPSTYYRSITGKKKLNMSYKRVKKYCIFHNQTQRL